jgi:hypothetical protein
MAKQRAKPEDTDPQAWLNDGRAALVEGAALAMPVTANVSIRAVTMLTTTDRARNRGNRRMRDGSSFFASPDLPPLVDQTQVIYRALAALQRTRGYLATVAAHSHVLPDLSNRCVHKCSAFLANLARNWLVHARIAGDTPLHLNSNITGWSYIFSRECDQERQSQSDKEVKATKGNRGSRDQGNEPGWHSNHHQPSYKEHTMLPVTPSTLPPFEQK